MRLPRPTTVPQFAPAEFDMQWMRVGCRREHDHRSPLSSSVLFAITAGDQRQQRRTVVSDQIPHATPVTRHCRLRPLSIQGMTEHTPGRILHTLQNQRGLDFTVTCHQRARDIHHVNKRHTTAVMHINNRSRRNSQAGAPPPRQIR